MELIQMIVQNDAAHAIIEALGQLGVVEFRDLNAGIPANKRNFFEEVRKCEHLDNPLCPPGAPGLLQLLSYDLAAENIPVGKVLQFEVTATPSYAEIEPKILQAYEEVGGLKESQDLLKKNHNSLLEQKEVLVKGLELYKTQKAPVEKRDTELMSLSEFGSSSGSMLGQVSGVIDREIVASLERVIFRATRGNAVFKSMEIEQELLHSAGSGVKVKKDFFMIFFAGDVLREKVSKIATHFGASLYNFPEMTPEHEEMSAEVARRIEESTHVMERGTAVLRETLKVAGDALGLWKYVVNKERMVHDALNMCEFDIKRHVFIAEAWVPKAQYSEVEAALRRTALERGLDTRPIINKLKSKLTPPTYIPVTSFSLGFQALVNTYGTPRYREANPGAFCCIFFPFLFGIMFGDFGHGALLAGFGYWLVTMEKKWEKSPPANDMVQMCYGGRYVILLNGLFGMYVGLCYNECFAFPMNFWGGSRWVAGDEAGFPTEEPCSPETEYGCVLDGNGHSPYPMGIDPIWHRTTNKITFFNSYKMKISIVIGVLQMSVGIFLSLLNHFEYKDYKKVFFQFIPEWTFFQGIFGYLVFTIWLKWATDWNNKDDPQPAPSLLTLLINMFMSPTTDITTPLYGHQCFTDCGAAAEANYCSIAVIAEACALACGDPFGEDKLHPLANPDLPASPSNIQIKICFSPLQSKIQLYLLLAAFIAVPFLLFPIPFIELAQHSSAKKYDELEEEGGHGGGGGGSGDHGEEFSFGDAFIHQAIHTIEFVLGSISNTASYLRLWALSLAHSQLADLFKEMILVGAGLNMGIGVAQPIVTFFTFAVWAVISFVVLMVMENLSSFLHALRLQWVEFQNKFFYGDGQKYAPFDFANLLKASAEE
jgi:V-type H+-transporting ATPase subunit a